MKTLKSPTDSDRDEGIGYQTVELPLRASASAGSEQTVGDGLGVEVGKLLLGQAGDEILLKCFVKAVDVFLFLGKFRADDIIAQEARASCQFTRQVFGSKGGRRGEREKVFEKLSQFLDLLGGWIGFQRFWDEGTGKQGAFQQNVVAVEAELIKIGQALLARVAAHGEICNRREIGLERHCHVLNFLSCSR